MFSTNGVVFKRKSGATPGCTASKEKFSKESKGMSKFCFPRNSFELEALQDSIREVKNKICAENVGKFENCVEVIQP